MCYFVRLQCHKLTVTDAHFLVQPRGRLGLIMVAERGHAPVLPLKRPPGQSLKHLPGRSLKCLPGQLLKRPPNWSLRFDHVIL